MAKKIHVYDGQYAISDYESKKGKIVLNCINTNDIYCVNNICATNVKSVEDCGIIAGIGDGKQIKYLVHVDLNSKEARAKVDVKYLNQALTAPALNQAIFLSGLPTKKIYSLDVTYKFGQKIEKELKQRHAEYYSEELKRNQHKVLNLVKQINNPHTK